MQKIFSYSGCELFVSKNAETLSQAVIEAVKSSADLSSANLRSADLSSADLSSANLRFADLRSANLRSADLRFADLRSADLSSANLSSANLSFANLSFADLAGVKVNWQSHDMISEILRRQAGEDTEKRKVAGLILVSRDWCWDKWLSINDPLAGWALDVLTDWVTEGDGAPEYLQKRAEKIKAEQATTTPEGSNAEGSL